MPQLPESPRMLGIKEQIERAWLFLTEALESENSTDKFRRLIAAIYFARSIVELMLEAADKAELEVSRDELEENIRPLLPRYKLVEKLRIHDFHRFGVLPVPGVALHGPLKLVAKKGGVLLQITPEGPVVNTTGDSEVIEQRPLYIKEDQVFDDEAQDFVTLEKVLGDYLNAVPSALKEFEKLRKLRS